MRRARPRTFCLRPRGRMTVLQRPCRHRQASKTLRASLPPSVLLLQPQERRRPLLMRRSSEVLPFSELPPARRQIAVRGLPQSSEVPAPESAFQRPSGRRPSIALPRLRRAASFPTRSALQLRNPRGSLQGRRSPPATGQKPSCRHRQPPRAFHLWRLPRAAQRQPPLHPRARPSALSLIHI